MRPHTPLTPLTALAAASVLVLTGCTAAGPAADAPADHHVAYLWAVGAEDAAIVETDDAMYVELSGVERVITRFSDRPDREASEVDLRDFLGRWEGRFAEVPPNAVLSYQAAEGAGPVQIVAELSRPRYHEATSTIVFAAEIIEYTPDTLEGAQHPVEVPEIALPAHTGPVSLFIDSVGPEVSPSEIAVVGDEAAAFSVAVDDLEALMLAVATRRANAIDAQITESLAALSAKNNRFAELNIALADVHSLIARFRPDAPADATLDGPGLSTTTAAALASFGVEVPGIPTRGGLDTLSKQLKGIIDASANTQQMDLLRLQTLIAKRDEALETMSAAMKKLTDAHNAIIRNLG